jgi:hypothetical protein
MWHQGRQLESGSHHELANTYVCKTGLPILGDCPLHQCFSAKPGRKYVSTDSSYQKEFNAIFPAWTREHQGAFDKIKSLVLSHDCQWQSIIKTQATGKST